MGPGTSTDTVTDLLISDDDGFSRVKMEAQDPASSSGDRVEMLIDARFEGGVSRGQLGTQSNHDVIILSNDQIRVLLEANGDICIGSCF